LLNRRLGRYLLCFFSPHNPHAEMVHAHCPPAPRRLRSDR
jgi:hypothetical protein